MRTAKSVQEDEEYEEDELVAKREGPASTYNANSSIGNSKDGKHNDKANAIRSKHSVTEQRRRSKINERFQILRDLIPHSDQKRDTVSFLLEVIEYVQYLQEKVQKYEGSYQNWSGEPTKLIPWRNSHWRMPTFVGHPESVKNGSASGPMYSGKFDDNNISISPAMLASSQNPLESHTGRDILQDADITNKVPLPMSLEGNTHASIRSDGVHDQSLHVPISDAQTTECPITNNASSQPEEMSIQGGTISVSSLYSEGLLNSLTQALQNTGLDLSQASISVQIDLGKRANKRTPCGTPIYKETGNPPSGHPSMAHEGDLDSEDDSDQVKKRRRT
ncbi:transcription factor BIM2-like [Cucurbita pepo subsp. pepo]|uniref:transcription factor BIM2-like n=1 Tax=Cucurbita pepo subsp. pepo TaxID=3664 RepID=UPI000C9D2F2B|nr:transcription factor BIM2-like [Cucurbita pepo subsp. pepo]